MLLIQCLGTWLVRFLPVHRAPQSQPTEALVGTEGERGGVLVDLEVLPHPSLDPLRRPHQGQGQAGWNGVWLVVRCVGPPSPLWVCDLIVEVLIAISTSRGSQRLRPCWKIWYLHLLIGQWPLRPLKCLRRCGSLAPKAVVLRRRFGCRRPRCFIKRLLLATLFVLFPFSLLVLQGGELRRAVDHGQGRLERGHALLREQRGHGDGPTHLEVRQALLVHTKLPVR
mmetsp:Transcript_116656/g.291263  ORF Transcript_116656/g.291263 Transcript_116656/m.291263 type:complete len:225 (+) Transcript_116656:561-1235(+)